MDVGSILSAIFSLELNNCQNKLDCFVQSVIMFAGITKPSRDNYSALFTPFDSYFSAIAVTATTATITKATQPKPQPQP
jgi:hypothetical protein